MSDEPSDTMRERVNQSQAKLWILLRADRELLAGVVLAGIFGTFIVFGVLDPAPLRAAVGSKDPIETLFEEYVAAIITGVTLVLTLNQLVLSQELGAVGDQRKRMRGAMDFREDVEESIDTPVTPPEPSAFLRSILDATQARANDLSEAIAECQDEQLREQTTSYVDSLTENAESVSDQLESAQFGTFTVLFAALNYNYSWKIYEARRLRHEYADELTEEADDAFEQLIEVLQFFGPAREHFKTLYFQWELADLSRTLLYVAIPAVVVTSGMVLYVDNPGSITGATFGIDNLIWVTSAASVVALSPFVLLLTYILRIVTIAKRTLSIGPFILRETDRSKSIDWDE